MATSNYNNINYSPITGDGDAAGGLYSAGNYELIVKALPVDLDDSISEATSLGTVTSTVRTVDASLVTDIDVNMVSFSVAAGQVVDFDIDTPLNGPGGLGSYLRLFNSQGTQLALNNDGLAPGENTLGFDSYLRYTFPTAGTYYLGVSNFNNIQYDPLTGNGDTAGGLNSIGSYQLIVQTAAAVVTDPNDAISEATAFGAVSTSPITVSATISPDTDVNMVGFSVSAGQVVDFDIDTTLNGAGGLGSYVRLFDSQGTQLAFNNDGAAPGENFIGFDAYLRYTFATAGTFYLGVSNFNNILYEPITGNGDTAGGANTTGAYQLIIQGLPVDTNDAISEATALGSVSATPITVNATIVTDIDVNMVSFTVTAGQIVDFDIDTPLNGPGGLGSHIRLFNASGQQLAFNNDAAARGENVVGFDAYLRYTFVNGGTYYLGVSNLNNIQYDPLTGNSDTAGGFNSIGSYRLILHSLSTTLAVTINVATIPERNGTAIGTVSRTDADLSQALVVALSSSDIDSATVPASVTILANQTSANFTITAVDDHIVSGTKSVTILATASGFTQGTGTLYISDSDSLWHNATNPNDVDDDHTVSPLDVLTIINYLNSVGSGPVTTDSPPPYLDVDSDNFVSPLDALVVINYLNSQNNGQGEGESASASTAVPLEFIDDYFANFEKSKSASVAKRGR